MGRSLLLLCVVVLTVPLIDGGYDPYDCRRSDQVCYSDVSGAACNTLDGACLCRNDAYTGFDCTLPRAQIVTGACQVPCQNGATCYSDDNNFTNKCYCQETDYGEFCELKRVSVECFPNSMLIRVNPHTRGFRGLIYVFDLAPRDFPQCEFEPVPLGPGYQGFFKNLSISDDLNINTCARRMSTVSLSQNGALGFTYEVMVRYNALIMTPRDEVHTVTCRHDANGVLQGVVIDVSPGLPLTGVEVTGRISVVYMDITQQSDRVSVIDNNLMVSIGDELFIEVILNGTTYKNHIVENCAVYNMPAFSNATGKAEKLLVQNECPAPDSLDAIMGPMTRVDNVIYIPITAFKFDNTGAFHLYCSVRVCRTDTDPDCAPRDCSAQYGGAGSGYGRKKRAESGERIDIEKKIYIVDYSGSPSSPLMTTKETVKTESCLNSVAFLVVAVVFGVLLVMTLVIAIVLYMRFSSRQRKSLGKDGSMG